MVGLLIVLIASPMALGPANSFVPEYFDQGDTDLEQIITWYDAVTDRVPQRFRDKIENIPKGIESVVVKRITHSDTTQLFKLLVFMAAFPEIIVVSDSIQKVLQNRILTFNNYSEPIDRVKLAFLLGITTMSQVDQTTRMELGMQVMEANSLDELESTAMLIVNLLEEQGILIATPTVGCSTCTATILSTQANEKGYKDITVEQARILLASDPNVVILDVRTLEEYTIAHIPGVCLIPYNEIEYNSDLLPTDLNTTILVYCGAGKRSSIASEVLTSIGYTEVYNMVGGLYGWEVAGFPLVEGELAGDQGMVLTSQPCSGDPPSCGYREFACCDCTAWDYICVALVGLKLSLCAIACGVCYTLPNPVTCASCIACVLWTLLYDPSPYMTCCVGCGIGIVAHYLLRRVNIKELEDSTSSFFSPQSQGRIILCLRKTKLKV
ncbi:MAG: rhodanese-like domain-containing protein [Candidatus Ranarchaeia archaeon]